MEPAELDSSLNQESDLSVQTRIQGHEKALEANPNDVASRMGLAQALMQGEKWMDAAEHLDKVVNDDAKNAQAPPLLARCYLSMGHMDKGAPLARCRARAAALLTVLAVGRSRRHVPEGAHAHRQREQSQCLDAGGQDVRPDQKQQGRRGRVQAGRATRCDPRPAPATTALPL